MKVKCNECGKLFKVSPKNSDPTCPKCGGVDFEPFEYFFTFFTPVPKSKRKVTARNYSTGPFDFMPEAA